MAFTGTLNLKLIEIKLNSPETEANKDLDLFVQVDQNYIYQTTTKNQNSILNESFTSQIENAKNLSLILYADAPKSADDFVAKCSTSFEDIQKKEKVGGLYELKMDLEKNDGGNLHFMVELIEKNENATNENRRSTIRKKIHQINGHKFQATLLKQPSYCSHCNEFIYGIGLQGYKCRLCRAVVHKKCHQNVETKCKSMKDSFPIDTTTTEVKRHNFEAHHFMFPTFCSHCGTMLYGIYKQGLNCKDCNMSVHKKCEDFVAKNCSKDAQQQSTTPTTEQQTVNAPNQPVEQNTAA